MSTSRTDEPLIVRVLQSYFPDWEPPKGRGRDWVSCLCPFHGDENPSASVSYTNDAFACHACGEKGGAIGIIMRKEGVSYQQAVKLAEKLSPGSSNKLQPGAGRKSGRRVFGESGSKPSGGRTVRPGIRSRTPPWA